jgi:hypothetical protein
MLHLRMLIRTKRTIPRKKERDYNVGNFRIFFNYTAHLGQFGTKYSVFPRQMYI